MKCDYTCRFFYLFPREFNRGPVVHVPSCHLDGKLCSADDCRCEDKRKAELARIKKESEAND